jgi:hypothetical protein
MGVPINDIEPHRWPQYIACRVSSIMSSSSRFVVTGQTSMTRDALGGAANKMSNSFADAGASQGYFKEGNGGGSNYMKDKLSGKT